MRHPSDSGAVTGEPEGPDPVFVDASGRRARLLRRTGYGAAGLAAGYLTVLALSLMGATPFAPEALLPPLPGDSSPTAPLRQDAEGDSQSPEDAGAGVGPGMPVVPLIAGAGDNPAGALLLPPGADPASVAGVPVEPPEPGRVEVTDGQEPSEEPGDAEEPGAPLAASRLETPVPWPNKLMAYPVNYRSHATEMPAVSTAAGFSPTALSLRPKRVRNSTHHVNGTMRKAI